MQTTSVIELLKNQLSNLEDLRTSSDFDSDLPSDILCPLDILPPHNSLRAETTQKFLRLSNNTSEIIKKRISQKEEQNFISSCLNNADLETKISHSIEYLKALISNIEKNPEHFKESQSDAYIMSMLNNMHKEVTKIAKDKMENKDYRGAVLDVCIALEGYVKKKSKKYDIGAKLMEKVFSADSPVIKISNKPEEQRGHMFLFSGAMKAIRNRYSHDINQVNPLQETLEILGFLSFLFRTVDENSV